jgi:hypothetical protein
MAYRIPGESRLASSPKTENWADHEICKIYSKSPFMGRKLEKITRNSHPFTIFVHRKVEPII